MNGKPDGILVGPGPIDPVSPMRRDEDVVTSLESAREWLVVETQGRFSLDQKDPFTLRLVVPESRRTGVAVRDDTFDLQAWSGQQWRALLFRSVRRWQVGEQIVQQVCSGCRHRSRPTGRPSYNARQHRRKQGAWPRWTCASPHTDGDWRKVLGSRYPWTFSDPLSCPPGAIPIFPQRKLQ